MFRCENKGCNKVVPRYQPINKIVTETRPARYVNEPTKRGRTEVETFGEEIVKEINVCPECYTNMTGEQPLRIARPSPPAKKKRSFKSDNRRPWQNPRQKNRREQPEKKQPLVETVKRPLRKQRNDKQNHRPA